MMILLFLFMFPCSGELSQDSRSWLLQGAPGVEGGGAARTAAEPAREVTERRAERFAPHIRQTNDTECRGEGASASGDHADAVDTRAVSRSMASAPAR